MRYVCILTAALLLALPGAAAAETFEVGPSVGTQHTTQTVFQKGKTYKITVTGTIDVTFDINQPKPPYHETYDALYCTKTDWPERKEFCTSSKPDPSISATQGFNYPITLNTERDKNGSNQPVPYESSHSYTRKITPGKNGRAAFMTRPYGSVPDSQKWTGQFTVTITEPGAKLCQGLPGTIVGENEVGEKVNRIIGTPEDDVIVGTNDNDLILGGGGKDVICGFGGQDVVNGGGGEDSIHGGAGPDRLIGGVDEFDDVIRGGSGDDHLSGGEGVDDLYGMAGDDLLDGGRYVFDEENRDRESLDGGPGDDELISRHRRTDADYSSSPGPITLDLAAGKARGWGKDKLAGMFRVLGSRFGDTLRGTEESDILNAGGGGDIIDGRGGDDFLNGGEGKDTITGGTGADRCEGETLTTCEVDATP